MNRVPEQDCSTERHQRRAESERPKAGARRSHGRVAELENERHDPDEA